RRALRHANGFERDNCFSGAGGQDHDAALIRPLPGQHGLTLIVEEPQRCDRLEAELVRIVLPGSVGERNFLTPQPEDSLAVAEPFRAPTADPLSPDESGRTHLVKSIQQQRALIEGESGHTLLPLRFVATVEKGSFENGMARSI